MHCQKLLTQLFLILFSLLLTACGRSGDNSLPDAPRDTIAPSLVSTNLPDNQTTVEVDSIIRIVFSELIDPTSLVEGVTLFSGEGGEQLRPFREQEKELTQTTVLGEGIDLVNGDRIDIDATEIYLKAADGRFALDYIYTIELSEIKDLADDPNTSEDEANKTETASYLEFLTQPGNWETEASILNLEQTTPIYDLSSASNLAGDTLFTWRQIDPVSGMARIWANRYQVNDIDYYSDWRLSDLSDTSSQAAELIDTTPDKPAFSPQIAINNNGQAAIAWYQEPTGSDNTSIWIRRFDEQWLAATNITIEHQGSNDAVDPQITIDLNGNILVVWREMEDGHFQLKSRRYLTATDENPTAAWEATETLFFSNNGNALAPKLSAQESGFSLLLWPQEVDDSTQLYTNQFSPQLGWQSEFRLDSAAGGDVSNPTIAIDSNQDAIAIWEETTNNATSLWWARYGGGAWATESVNLLENNNLEDAFSPQIKVNSVNQYIAHWQEGSPTDSAIKVQYFSPDSGWEIEADQLDAGYIESPTMVFDAVGNGNFIWSKGEQNKQIVVNRYINNIGWTQTNTLELPPLPSDDPCSSGIGSRCAISSFPPIMAPLKHDGRMIAVWPAIYKGDYKLAWTLFSNHPEQTE